MTVSVPPGGVWTVDDLYDHTHDDGNRYEIADGRLLVSPPPPLPHCSANERLRHAIARQLPAELCALAVGAGIDLGRRRTYYVPDLVVVPRAVLSREGDTLHPSEVVMVAEVLSKGNARVDLVLKRHDYARVGIPMYWIVDRSDRTLTVLDGAGYREETVVRPGGSWSTDSPFPMTIDPAEFL